MKNFNNTILAASFVRTNHTFNSAQKDRVCRDIVCPLCGGEVRWGEIHDDFLECHGDSDCLLYKVERTGERGEKSIESWKRWSK